jgi:effector-binding domain-containing protein
MSQMGRFETEAMTFETNRSALTDLSGRPIDRARRSGAVANVVRPAREGVMAYAVTVETLGPRTLAAVRRRVATNDIGKEFRPALDVVWAFLKKHPGLRTDGHNVFLYHHGNQEIVQVDFGVEVVRTFTGEGEVQCVTTPAGEAAVVVHRGRYEKMHAAHHALHEWCAANRRTIGGYSLEIYGDWSDDPSKLETTIQYLLR